VSVAVEVKEKNKSANPKPWTGGEDRQELKYLLPHFEYIHIISIYVCTHTHTNTTGGEDRQELRYLLLPHLNYIHIISIYVCTHTHTHTHTHTQIYTHTHTHNRRLRQRSSSTSSCLILRRRQQILKVFLQFSSYTLHSKYTGALKVDFQNYIVNILGHCKLLSKYTRAL